MGSSCLDVTRGEFGRSNSRKYRLGRSSSKVSTTDDLSMLDKFQIWGNRGMQRNEVTGLIPLKSGVWDEIHSLELNFIQDDIENLMERSPH